MNALKLSLLGLFALAGCAASKPPPAVAPPDAMNRAPTDIAAPQAEDTDMTYTPKETTAAVGHDDTPVTSVRPKDAAAQGKTPH
jgi:hypothetical protein